MARPQNALRLSGPVVERNCLKCSNPFESQGNRICPKCTEENIKVAKRVGRGASRHTGGIGRAADYD